MKNILLLLSVLGLQSFGAINFSFHESKNVNCPSGMTPRIDRIVMEIDVSCYGYGDEILVNVSNSPLSEQPTEGLHVFQEHFSQCGILTRTIPLKKFADKVDVHKKMYARVTALGEDYTPMINAVGFATYCE